MLNRLRQPPADLSVFHEFAPPPTGGGHQFMRALCREFTRRGLKLSHNRLQRASKAALFNSFNFNIKRLERAFSRNGNTRKVHRLDGPLAVYRGFDDGTDRQIAELNERWANASVFQSRFSLEAHLELGFHPPSPVIIPNTPDPDIFHSRDRVAYDPERKLRVISVSWSDNPNKGLDVYRWLDAHLDPEVFEHTFVGRIQTELRHTRHLPPMDSTKLAQLLRQQDVYLTASLNDPCSNSVLEALACDLPVVYRNSGGHPELVGDAGLPFDDPAEIPSQLLSIASRFSTFQKAIHIPSLEETATQYLSLLFPHDYQ